MPNLRHHFRITARLVSPLAGDPPPLDSLFERAMGKHLGSVRRSSGGHRHPMARNPYRGMEMQVSTIPIPIDRAKIGDRLIPLCSSPIIPKPARECAEYFTQRFPSDRAEYLDPSQQTIVVTNGGPYKSYRLPLRVRLVDRVVWFCSASGRTSPSGTKSASAQIRRLTRSITAIGRKTSIGYGAVGRWDVQEIPDDWSWFAPDDDRLVLMRPLPDGDWLPKNLDGFVREHGPCASPYWNSAVYMPIVLPC